MSDKLEVVKAELPVPSVAHMLQEVIKAGITPDNVAALEKLCGLYERMEARNAEKEFAEAFVRLQQEIPKIQATKSVPNNDGTVRYAFAPFEEIDTQARPICLRNGFTYWFAEGESQPGKLTKVCWLQHVGGHKRSNDYSVRIGKGPPGCSESQADGAAHMYAKRGALTDALNIVVKGQDNDARLQGAPVTAQQAKSLRDRVMALAIDVDGFLRYGGAKTFETIPASNYAMLDASLKKKEKVS